MILYAFSLLERNIIAVYYLKIVCMLPYIKSINASNYMNKRFILRKIKYPGKEI